MKAHEIKQAFDELNAKYKQSLEMLRDAYQLLDSQQASQGSGDMQEAARLMAHSEMNKEDLSESEILEMLQKLSEEEVKRKMGFWAMPLPTGDDDTPANIKYTGKRR